MTENKTRVRLAKIKRMVKIAKTTKALVRTGAWPQAKWGAEALGMAPSTLKAIRGRMATAGGHVKQGGCTTTALALEGDEDKDPAVSVHIDILLMWMSVSRELKSMKKAVETVWEKWRTRLQNGKSRWNKVTGHMAAVVATLLQIEWEPLGPWKWRSPDGQTWEVDPWHEEIREELKETLLEYLTEAKWERAANHRHGGGLGKGGPDLTVGKRMMKKANTAGEHERRGCMHTVMQGACWPPDRRQEAGYISKQMCCLCKEELEEVSEMHQIWECKGLQQLQLKEITETQKWVRHEVADCEENPALWLR